MTRLKLLAAFALCLAYLAGIATGWAGYTLAGEQPPPPGEKGSWLSHMLQLDSDQKAKMEEIWSPEALNRDGEDARARIRSLYDERNAQVRAILTEEQQAAFDEIYRAFEVKKEALSEARRKRHDEAVEKTMAILTPAQREKYQKIIEDFEKRGSKGEHGPSGWRPGK